MTAPQTAFPQTDVLRSSTDAAELQGVLQDDQRRAKSRVAGASSSV
jgi:hypothetical protein